MENNNKKILTDIIEKIKKILSNKIYLIITIVVVVLLILAIVLFLLPNKSNSDKTSDKYILDKAYDVYPDEVRSVYSNFVDVSCDGDIHFNLDADGGSVDVTKLDNQDLLNYMFSYMEKNSLLTDEIKKNQIKEIERNLFDKKIDIVNKIKSFSYNGYTYNLSGNKVKRVANACSKVEKMYVTHLYGYYLDAEKNTLSIDVMAGYLKDGILYTLDDKEMGKYDGDKQKLSTLMEIASYYRASYTRYDKGKYKLASIELKRRT